ncbi:hypothetical protein BJ912DRAFT_920887 [Pholiota molesta]|nr:hypothetical protein BJ912DRAFT_920887 [Pholiota molesta]
MSTTHGEHDAHTTLPPTDHHHQPPSSRREPLPSNEGCGPAILLDTADAQGPPLTVTPPPLPPATLLPPSTLPTTPSPYAPRLPQAVPTQSLALRTRIPPLASTVDAHGGRPPSTNGGQRAWRTASEQEMRPASTNGGQLAQRMASQHETRPESTADGGWGHTANKGVRVWVRVASRRGAGASTANEGQHDDKLASQDDSQQCRGRARTIASNANSERRRRSATTTASQRKEPAGANDGQQLRKRGQQPDDELASQDDSQQRQGRARTMTSNANSQRRRRPASEDGQQPASTTDGQRADARPASEHEERLASTNDGQRVRWTASEHERGPESRTDGRPAKTNNNQRGRRPATYGDDDVLDGEGDGRWGQWMARVAATGGEQRRRAFARPLSALLPVFLTFNHRKQGKATENHVIHKPPAESTPSRPPQSAETGALEMPPTPPYSERGPRASNAALFTYVRLQPQVPAARPPPSTAPYTSRYPFWDTRHICTITRSSSHQLVEGPRRQLEVSWVSATVVRTRCDEVTNEVHATRRDERGWRRSYEGTRSRVQGFTRYN